VNPDTARLRLAVLGIVVISLFAALLSRLWYLQVIDSPNLQRVATLNQIRFVYEQAPRGRILDRQGKVLVDNRFALVVTLNRVDAKAHPTTVTRLAALLNVKEDDVRLRLADPRFTPYRPVPIAEDVTKDIATHVREHQAEFPGVEVHEQAQRIYPNGSLAAHLLGYVAEANRQEIDGHRSQGYRDGDDIGKLGVEKSFEQFLRGTPGVTKLEVDSQGRVLRTLNRLDPVQGHDVQLTIDLDVQKLAEESLAKGLDAARGTHDRNTNKNFVAPAGAAAVIDPRDGSVLALASNPTYDPTLFINGIKPDAFKALQDPAGHYPLNNRALSGLYSPGSTFKLATAVAALRKGLIAGNTTFNDTGSFTVGNRTFKNAGGARFGRVNVTRALTVSSDVFFYTLGASFWEQRSAYGPTAIQETAKELGLGAATGIDLPGEAKGRIPDPESRKKLHADNPTAFPNGGWFAGDNVNLAIGQGEMAVTPLQLANAYATFANGGKVYQPRIAARVLDSAGKTTATFGPSLIRSLDLSPAIRTEILTGLEGVTTDARGTATAAFAGFPSSQFPVAGKTGTAQVFGKQDTALFASFGPATDPRFAMAVIMEESGFGGSAAAPVSRRIWEALSGHPPGEVSLTGGRD
jgi:penicillin-binding protein 2